MLIFSESRGILENIKCIPQNLKESRAGNHLWPYKMFRMNEEKEAKQAKEEKELKKEREKEKKKVK